MTGRNSRQIIRIILMFALALTLAVLTPRLPFLEGLNTFCYDKLMAANHKLKPVDPKAKEIVFVTLDDQTLKKIGERWPFSREKFTKVIENLKNSGAKAIGFDFVFHGNSNPEDDEKLGQALQGSPPVVLASVINEQGELDRSLLPNLGPNTRFGLVSKIQDADHAVRKNLTYIVSEQNPNEKIFSWEWELLKAAGSEEKIESVPLADPVTSSFWINFDAHSEDFERLSFYEACQDSFNPEKIRGKICLIGFFSAKLQDIHNTPLGWMPGITLNANAFLTLYSGKFLRGLPRLAEAGLFFVFILFHFIFRNRLKGGKLRSFVLAEILVFFLLSGTLMASGFVLNYIAVPGALILYEWVPPFFRESY